MRTFAQNPKASEQTASAKDTPPARSHSGQRPELSTNLNATAHFDFDFSRIPVHARTSNEGTADAGAHDKQGLRTNLNGVRLHTDARASTEAEAINAAAFTKGKEIFFGAGRYQPKLPAGQRLLFHEMAHVVQQQNPGQHASTDALEREADRAAADAMAGREPQIDLAASPDRTQRQSTSWTTGDVFVDQTATNQILNQGGLFSGNDQAHITVSSKGKLAYDASYTTPEDQFRWSRLKEIVDSGHLKISAVSDKQPFKIVEVPGQPPADRSIADIRGIVGDPTAMGITLIVKENSPDPTYNQIFYDKAQGVGALSHELFGHAWLALKGAPHVHPKAGTPAEKTMGTITPANKITDAFGNVYSGTVREYIAKNVESLGTNVKVTTSTGQQISVPKSPTQQVGQEVVVKALADLNNQAPTGLTKTTYNAAMAQTWRTLCNNYDLMPTNFQGLKAGNANLTYTKEILLIMCFMLFRSWKPDQQSGFRILLADFTNSRGGFTPNELSSKLEAAVGMAASPFNPATSGSSLSSPGVGGLQLSNPTGNTGP